MSYTIHPLIDITPTGKHRNRNDEGKAVDQQTNWLTFQNCAMLRTNMEFGKVSMKEQIVDKYLFGKDFEGKQKVWSVTVTTDRSDVVTLDMVQEVIDLVPKIT